MEVSNVLYRNLRLNLIGIPNLWYRENILYGLCLPNLAIVCKRISKLLFKLVKRLVQELVFFRNVWVTIVKMTFC